MTETTNKNQTDNSLVERVITEREGERGTVQRIELTKAGKQALTTKASSLGTGFYVPRSQPMPTNG